MLFQLLALLFFFLGPTAVTVTDALALERIAQPFGIRQADGCRIWLQEAGR
ncbi:MAG: hypothetical protein AVDCRST_MAG42-856 [uncultured Chthoniobacterales bacterium]|uniref:Uncharacterized protein n=1 Tax=uncultured Chthoniobacterales bacterium TaxID=1836801 RepID=A0A6J4GZM4_9BACT|nr:MAG: hypothetical protein AVDCRST_MAG42-856 [uncultured Chthoniobacterales bacterium]